MPLKCIRDHKAKQCSAKSKRSGQRCQNPVKGDKDGKGGSVCRMHGWRALSTVQSGSDHWNYRGAQRSREDKAAAKKEMQEVEQLAVLAKKCGLIN